MASFTRSYNNTAAKEGGYIVDNGGVTYKGISWKGWVDTPYPNALAKEILTTVLSYKPKPKQIINSPALEAKIFAFYKQNYWDKVKGDKINNEQLADFIYDFCINSNAAFVKINRLVSSTGDTQTLSSKTVAALNANPAGWYAAIWKLRKQHYDNLAAKNKKFVTNGTYKGWINRLKKFPETITV